MSALRAAVESSATECARLRNPGSAQHGARWAAATAAAQKALDSALEIKEDCSADFTGVQPRAGIHTVIPHTLQPLLN
jgi:hypothetical protein